MEDKVKKITAYRELLRKMGDRSYTLYAWENDYYNVGSGRYRDVDWDFPLRRDGMLGKDTLNDVLERLTWADFPKTLEKAEKEAELVRLVLEAGGNPNQTCYNGETVFSCFMIKNRIGAALEIAKHPDFQFPRGKENKIFDMLAYNIASNKMHHPCYRPIQRKLESDPSLTKNDKEKLGKELQEGLKYHKVWQKQSEDLIFMLFGQGVYPQRNTELFKSLVSVVLKRDSEFFNKRKQRFVKRMTQAKTPVAIYDVLMGERGRR